MGITDHNTRRTAEEAPDHANAERTELNIDLIPILQEAMEGGDLEELIDEALEDVPDHDIATTEPERPPKCMERVEHYDTIGQIYDDDNDRCKSAKAQLQEIEKAVDKKRRKDHPMNQGVTSDQNRITEHIFTTSPEWFRPDDPDAQGKWDKDRVRDWIIGTCKRIIQTYEDNSRQLVSADVHLDEATPHAHTEEAPLTNDGRLASSDIYGPEGLSEMQTKYAECLPDGIDRGEIGSERDHLTKRELIQQERNELRDEVRELQEKVNELEGVEQEAENLSDNLDDLRQTKQNLEERVDELQGEVQEKDERIQDLEETVADLTADQIHGRADQVRRLPDHLLDDLLEDPTYGENAIDQIMNEKGLNFAEATVFIYRTETIQQFLAQESVKSQISSRRSSPDDPIETEFREKLDEEGTYQELKDELVKTKEENETLKDKLDEVAEEHGLEIEAGDFYADYSDDSDPDTDTGTGTIPSPDSG